LTNIQIIIFIKKNIEFKLILQLLLIFINMVCGIYKIKNNKNNKIYIGSSINIESREYKHFWMLRKNIHDNSYLQHSFNKFGEECFSFEIIELCSYDELIFKENHYINVYKSNIPEFGYNLATVNDFRRNTYNNEVKVKLSKHNLNKFGNFNKFSLINIETGDEFVFESLVEGADYLIKHGFAKGKPRNVRMTLSNSLRGKKLNNGKGNRGSIRKTCYKHNFKIIN
jgi:group I intron endonuclease